MATKAKQQPTEGTTKTRTGRRTKRTAVRVEEPLFEGIRKDREQARNSRPAANPQRPRRVMPRNRAEFTAQFAMHIVERANQHRWSPIVRQLVLEYIKSLTEEGRDGTAPEGLRGTPLKVVQQKFAMSVLLCKPKDVEFPGTTQPWFDDALRAADAYRASRRVKSTP